MVACIDPQCGKPIGKKVPKQHCHSKIVTESDRRTASPKEDLLFFPVAGITLQTVGEGKQLVSYTTTRALEGADGVERNAVKATVNGKEVALFYWKEQLFCVDAQCPHMGGPLHLGDIEELPSGPCIVCPWHKFCFSLSDGRNVRPGGRSEILMVHPVRIDSYQRVCVGFAAFDSSCFTSEEF